MVRYSVVDEKTQAVEIVAELIDACRKDEQENAQGAGQGQKGRGK